MAAVAVVAEANSSFPDRAGLDPDATLPWVLGGTKALTRNGWSGKGPVAASGYTASNSDGKTVGSDSSASCYPSALAAVWAWIGRNGKHESRGPSSSVLDLSLSSWSFAQG